MSPLLEPFGCEAMRGCACNAGGERMCEIKRGDLRVPQAAKGRTGAKGAQVP